MPGANELAKRLATTFSPILRRGVVNELIALPAFCAFGLFGGAAAHAYMGYPQPMAQ